MKLFCALFDEEPDVFAFILLNQHAHLRFVTGDGNAVEELRESCAAPLNAARSP